MKHNMLLSVFKEVSLKTIRLKVKEYIYETSEKMIFQTSWKLFKMHLKWPVILQYISI